jgi:hypothetical protein
MDQGDIIPEGALVQHLWRVTVNLKVMLLTSITDDMVYAQAMTYRIGTYNTGTTLVCSLALGRLQACCSD